MKLRLNKKALAEMPAPVRSLVQAWKDEHHKSFISVETRPSFLLQEDARVTLINLLTGKQQTERVAGEYAGMTKLSPTGEVDLPVGMVAIEERIFLGHHYLTIYQGGERQPLKLSGTMVEVSPATRGGFGCNMDYQP